MMGFLNGDRLDQRLVQCHDGFFPIFLPHRSFGANCTRVPHCWPILFIQSMCILELDGLDGPLSLLQVDTL